jgi:hypothetical protein
MPCQQLHLAVLASTAGLNVSAEVRNVQDLPEPIKDRNRVMELRSKGAAVYQFEGGEPYRPTPDYIKQAVTAALQENKTRYAPSSGIPELRRAIADKLRTRNNIDAKEENVIVVNGGMQGLFGAFQSTIDPITPPQTHARFTSTRRRTPPALSSHRQKQTKLRASRLIEIWWSSQMKHTKTSSMKASRYR